MNHTTISVPTVPYTDETFDAFEMDFAEGEHAEKPLPEEERLWWFNGLSTDTDMTAVGWHLKAGINSSLDETMHAMGMQPSLVQHQRPDKDGKTDPKFYWRLREASLIVVARQLQSSLEMRDVENRAGIAFAWEPTYDDKGQPELNKQGKPKRKTTLKMRVYIHELVMHGYNEWFLVQLSGYSTDTMLQALNEQYRALDSYSDYRRAQGKKHYAPFYLLSLPTAPGAPKLVGGGPDPGKIFPITTQVPEKIDKTYLAAHLPPTPLLKHIRGHVIDDTVKWSIDESKRMDQGRQGQGEQLALKGPSEEPPVVQDAADPLVQQAQIKWIVEQYCKGDTQKVPIICAYFGVSRPEELHMSQFKELVGQKGAALRIGG